MKKSQELLESHGGILSVLAAYPIVQTIASFSRYRATIKGSAKGERLILDRVKAAFDWLPETLGNDFFWACVHVLELI